MSSLIYFFKESLRGFSRNISTTLGSIITIFLSLLIIGVFLLGGFIVESVMSSVESHVSITVYIADDADQNQVSQLQSDIQGLEDVQSIDYTSKEQAREKFRNSMTSNPDLVEQLDVNPFPASIGIELSDPQKVEEVVQIIAADPNFQSICDDKENPADSIKYGEGTVERLFLFTNYIRYIGIALIALLIFIAMIFINNTIRLAILARRKEIGIMRLVGASNGFIRGPFLMEGALHAVIGALLAIGSIELLRAFALPVVSSAIIWLPLDLGVQTYLMMYGILLAAGLLIGFIGSLFAMRRYLKV